MKSRTLVRVQEFDMDILRLGKLNKFFAQFYRAEMISDTFFRDFISVCYLCN